MSSSSPPPPPAEATAVARSQRTPLHNFELPSDLKWSTKPKTPSTHSPPAPRLRWRRLVKGLPSSSRQQPHESSSAAANTTAAASEQLSPKEAIMLDWLHENLSNKDSKPSSGPLSPRPSSEKTTAPDSESFPFEPFPLQSKGDVSGSSSQKSTPLRIKISTSCTSSSQGPSSFRFSINTSKLGSPSEGASSSSLSFINVTEEETNCIDLLSSGFSVDNPNKGSITTDSTIVSTTFAPEKMIEEFEKTLSFSDFIIEEPAAKKGKQENVESLKKEEKIPAANVEAKMKGEEKEHAEPLFNKGKKEVKPLKTYARNPQKRKNQGVVIKEKKLEIVEPQAKTDSDPEYKPVVEVPENDDDDSEDLNTKIWNLRTRNKPNRKTEEVLNLDKNAGGSSSKDDDTQVEELPVEDRKGKQVMIEDMEFKSTGENIKKKNPKKNKKQKKNKKKNNNKNKGKEPVIQQEQEEEEEEEEEQQQPEEELPPDLRLPTFLLQLTPQEIADDLFILTGARPPRRPHRRRPKTVQRNIDQLTPGLWLESVDEERYKVHEKAGKGKKKKKKKKKYKRRY